MKTRDAKTIRELSEIHDAAIDAEIELLPAWNRAYCYHDGKQSRHFRRIASATRHHISIWSAAARRMIELEKKTNPDFVF